ncbi:MAG: CRTAC1 family protein [Planctomycetes bacterium]|nr:CRTAC1 family protein [Planctomycetota bacterium]
MMTRKFAAPMVLALAAGAAGQTFTNATADAGLDNPFVPMAQTEYFWVQTFMCANASVGDFDADGWDDVFTFQGSTQKSRLYKNMGDGTFVDVAHQYGLDFRCLGSCSLWADYDGNGTLDLFLQTFADLPEAQHSDKTGAGGSPGGMTGGPQTGPGATSGPTVGSAGNGLPFWSDLDKADQTQFSEHHNYLYRNDGGSFTEVAGPAGLKAAGRYGAAFGDLDGDGDLDLVAVSHNNGSNDVYENRGNGTFRKRTPDVISHQKIRGFTPQIWDYDQDGKQDIGTSGDWKTSKLFRNLGGFQFEDVTSAAGVGIDQNGMGSTVGDYDNDGDFDWFVTAIWSDVELPGNTGELGDRLYQNNGDGTFTDVTVAAGVDNGGWGWGAYMGDLDNDGMLDIAHQNGWMFPPFDNDLMRIFKNVDGQTFVDSAASMNVADPSNGRGLAMFDYDHDGDLDIITASFDKGVQLFRNEGPTGNWLEVRLQGAPGHHPHGAGAIVKVRSQPSEGLQTQMRRIAYESNYVSQSPAMAWFGTKAATSVTVEVSWPGGQTVQYTNVATNQRITLVEP